MATVKDLVQDCEKDNVSGIEVDVYFTCADELESSPRTVAQVKAGTAGYIQADGDTVRVGEAYKFKSNLPTGQGYWRKFSIITDTGELKESRTITKGTSNIKSMLTGSLKNYGAVEKEFINKLLACCGLVMVVVDKSSEGHEFGRANLPAIGEKAEGGTGGDFRGYDVEFMAQSQPRSVDLKAFPLNRTPKA